MTNGAMTGDARVQHVLDQSGFPEYVRPEPLIMTVIRDMPPTP